MKHISVHPIKAFSDNYIWMLLDEEKKVACVVDPGDAEPVFRELSERNILLDSILITHHHFDHTGGLQILKDKTNCRVYGPISKQINGIDVTLKENDNITIFDSHFKILEIPGHTLDHIAYYHACERSPILFCGDTLFAGGCGRVFEGTHEMMHDSLQKLSSLPDKTLVYCSHEYTEANLRFAKLVEPSNEDLICRYKNVVSRRRNKDITLPSSIEIEKKTNPFLRCDAVSLLKDIQKNRSLSNLEPKYVFSVVRSWKDTC